MGHNRADEEDRVGVPLKALLEVESELLAALDVLDAVVRLRVQIMRVQRLVRELDPDRTPTRPVSVDPGRAYRVSSPPTQPPDSIVAGPRFHSGPKKKGPGPS